MDLTPREFDVGGALLNWLAVFGTVGAIVLGVGLLVTLATRGPKGVAGFGRAITGTLKDLVLIAPGRVFAVAQLTWREALRRRALYVFALFAVLFMFAGWFLSNSGSRPADQVKVYVSFVLTVVSWLTLLVMLLLSCWGIPEDIRRRSLHTVVTKPARRSEVVLGRMLGYTLIGTVLLGVMGLFGYVWIERQAGDAEGALTARRPLFGDVRFTGRGGQPVEKGLNVGNVWEYRGYIDGASLMKAVYAFEGVDESLMRDVRFENAETGDTERGRVLQFESDFEGFRTVKGDMSRGLLIQYTYVNPETGLTVADPAVFSLEEFDGNVHNVPETLLAYDEELGEERAYDLMKDLVSADGRLEVEVRSLDPQQLLGLGKADLFVRPPDADFWTSYAASVAAIWLKMALLVALGVTAGTFVKGPVATLLVFTLLIVGQTFQEFMGVLLAGTLDPTDLDGIDGGGPVEATYRIVTHANTVKNLPPGPATDVVKALDYGLLSVLWAFSQLIPDLSAFDTAARTAAGFSVPVKSQLLPAAAVTVAFLIPCYVVGTLSLRSRELEAK